MQGRGTQRRSSEVMEILEGGQVSGAPFFLPWLCSVLSFWTAASQTHKLPLLLLLVDPLHLRLWQKAWWRHRGCCRSKQVAPYQTFRYIAEFLSVCRLKAQTIRWPLPSWGQAFASASHPPWTSPAGPPSIPRQPPALWLGRCQGRQKSGPEPEE